MQSYDLYFPTHLVFVKGRVAELGKLAAGRGKRVLITYGGGSVRRTGLLDEVKAQLKDFEVFEFGGIEPNRTEAFFRSLGIPAKLSEVGVRAEDFEAMAEHVEKFWYPLSGAFTPMDRAGALGILKASF